MKVYCVFREGVYRHECGGVFDTLAAAIDAADWFADNDNDSYHSYNVSPFEMNERTQQDPHDRDGERTYFRWSPDMFEHEVVYTVKLDTKPAQRRKHRRKALDGVA